MSQTGYSKVQIYSSSTASNTPSASNLTNDTNGSELAINITDGKLFYKDNGGTVQVIASKASNIGNFSSDITIHGLTVGLGGGSVSTNTAVGVNALNATNTGGFNTGVGDAALQSNTSGTWNSALGFGSLNSNTSGSNNTSVGGYALVNNTTASNSTAVGYQAAYNNTTGTTNTAVGYQALYTCTTGANNTSLGYRAGYFLTNGTDNVSIGYQAGAALTTGTWNTCVGDNAGFGNVNLTSGTYNVMIGANTSPGAGSDNNELVIGAYSTNVTGKGSNTGFINAGGGGVYQGNNSAAWSITSDERLKKNIVDNTVGLSAITQIKIRNFEYRLPDEITDLDKSTAVAITGTQLGPIAQELQQVLPDCVKTESTGVMSVDSSDVLWHLVTAVQQLNALVTAQATEIQALKAKLGV